MAATYDPSTHFGNDSHCWGRTGRGSTGRSRSGLHSRWTKKQSALLLQRLRKHAQLYRRKWQTGCNAVRAAAIQLGLFFVLLTGCLAELVALRPFEWLATVADKPPRAWLVAATAVLAVVGGVHTLSIARRLILWADVSRAERAGSTTTGKGNIQSTRLRLSKEQFQMPFHWCLRQHQ